MSHSTTPRRVESTPTSHHTPSIPTPREICREFPALEPLLLGHEQFGSEPWIASVINDVACEQNNVIRILEKLCNSLDSSELYGVLFSLKAQMVALENIVNVVREYWPAQPVQTESGTAPLPSVWSPAALRETLGSLEEEGTLMHGLVQTLTPLVYEAREELSQSGKNDLAYQLLAIYDSLRRGVDRIGVILDAPHSKSAEAGPVQ